MGNNLKVLLTGDGSEFGKNCANILRTYGCDVVLVPKDGKTVLSKINNDSIDVVVMDALLPLHRTFLLVDIFTFVISIFKG